jgi:hypothetical protein
MFQLKVHIDKSVEKEPPIEDGNRPCHFCSHISCLFYLIVYQRHHQACGEASSATLIAFLAHNPTFGRLTLSLEITTSLRTLKIHQSHSPSKSDTMSTRPSSSYTLSTSGRYQDRQSDSDFQRHGADRQHREGRAQDRFGQQSQLGEKQLSPWLNDKKPAVVRSYR